MNGGRRSAAVLAVVLAVGCGDATIKAGRGAQSFEAPSAAEREALEKLGQAKALIEAGGGKEAEPLLRRAVELSPRNAKALALLADLTTERRAYAEAAPLLRRLVEAAPDDVVARRKLCDALAGLRDWTAAAGAAREWTIVAKDDSDAWFALGCALAELGRLDGAEQALRTAAARKATRADVRSRLGLVLLAKGKAADAEAAQRDALRRANPHDPVFAEAWARLADVIALGGSARRAEAVQAYRRSVEADPRFGPPRVRLYRETRLLAKDDPSKAPDAAREWKDLVAAAARDMLPWDGLGAPPADGDQAKEERVLRQALSGRPDDAATRVKYATLLHRRGEIDRAAAEYVEAGKDDPTNARARSALGAALLVKGDPAAAEAPLREGLRLDPSDETSWRNLGWALLVLGRDADAVLALDEALKRYDGDRLAHRARGLAKMHAGDLEGGEREIVEAGRGGR